MMQAIVWTDRSKSFYAKLQVEHTYVQAEGSWNLQYDEKHNRRCPCPCYFELIELREVVAHALRNLSADSIVANQQSFKLLCNFHQREEALRSQLATTDVKAHHFLAKREKCQHTLVPD